MGMSETAGREDQAASRRLKLGLLVNVFGLAALFNVIEINKPKQNSV